MPSGVAIASSLIMKIRASLPARRTQDPALLAPRSSAGQGCAGRRRGGLRPSVANRLTIGFAIAFAVLTGLSVIGVARFLQQRQDFEDATARSYEVEIHARNRLAEGRPPAPERRV